MENNKIPVTKVHAYNVSVAADVGINAAVIFYNICFWVEENYSNKRNYINGKYWTYNTIKAFEIIFPEMTGKQIEYALKKLKENGYIESAVLSEDTRDRTNWYTVCDFNKWISPNDDNQQKKETIHENSEMVTENSEMYNNINNNIDNISVNNNTDNKQSDNHALFFDKNKGRVHACFGAKQGASPSYSDKQLEERLTGVISEYAYDVENANVIFDIFMYFYKEYELRFGRKHPILSDKTYEKIITAYYEPVGDEISNTDVDIDDYKHMIDLYFDTDYNKRGNYGGEVDKSLQHFFSGQIRNHLLMRVRDCEDYV